MKTNEVRSLAKELFAVHGLNDWTFQFDNAVRRHGYCSHVDKVISMSVNYIRLNTPELIKDTLLHEIAHALCPKYEGHGKKWKAVCLEIGATPVAQKRDMGVVHPKGKWRATCPSCDTEFDMHRRPGRGMRYSCYKCSGGYFNEKYEIVYKKED